MKILWNGKLAEGEFWRGCRTYLKMNNLPISMGGRLKASGDARRPPCGSDPPAYFKNCDDTYPLKETPYGSLAAAARGAGAHRGRQAPIHGVTFRRCGRKIRYATSAGAALSSA
jgi:hypothetical protein